MNLEVGILHGGAFVAGAIVGSFANVCIHRLPRGESVVAPASRCPACGTPIAAYDNLPVLSWLLLGGRCRSCRASISGRYPAIELAVALLFLGSSLLWGPTLLGAAAALLSAASVILVATDLESRVLPDEVTIGAMLLGFFLAGLRDLLARPVPFRLFDSHLFESLAGAASGAALLYLVRAGYHMVRGVEGMGLGDVKMIAMIGALTGPPGVLLTLFFASLAGSLVGGAFIVGQRVTWSRAFRKAARGPSEAGEVAARCGVLVDGDGRVASAARRWTEVPGAAPPGALARSSSSTARPIAAFVRLAARRGRRGLATSFSRLVVDDGADFFRVLAARAGEVPGGLLVCLARGDIPFGVFLAAGSLAAFALGRPAVARLLGDASFRMRLLP